MLLMTDVVVTVKSSIKTLTEAVKQQTWQSLLHNTIIVKSKRVPEMIHPAIISFLSLCYSDAETQTETVVIVQSKNSELLWNLVSVEKPLPASRILSSGKSNYNTALSLLFSLVSLIHWMTTLKCSRHSHTIAIYVYFLTEVSM